MIRLGTSRPSCRTIRVVSNYVRQPVSTVATLMRQLTTAQHNRRRLLCGENLDEAGKTVATGYQKGYFRRESERRVSSRIPRIAPIIGAKNIPGPSFIPEMKPSQNVRN